MSTGILYELLEECFCLPILLPAHLSKLELVSSALCMRHRCVKHCSEERLNKQAGPGTKSLPLRDMWQQNPLNRPPPLPNSTLDPLHSYWSHTNHSTYPELGAKRRKDGGGGGANSDFYSLNVTTSQRGPHDTATKSELMDSFLSPANMTGGVCVRERGCGRRTGAGVGACLPH